MYFVIKKYTDKKDVKLIHDCREGMAYKNGQPSLHFIYKVDDYLIMPVSFYGSTKQAINSNQYKFAIAMGFEKELRHYDYSKDTFERIMDSRISEPGNYRIGKRQVIL